MDEYYKYYYENEGKYFKKIQEEEKKYQELFYDYILKEYGEELYNEYKNLCDNIFECDSIWKISLIFDKSQKNIRDFVKKNILSKLNKENIIISYMQLLTHLLVLNKIEDINCCMNLLKDTKLIKNIKLKNNIFIITTLNNKIVKFTKLLDNLEQVESFKNMCHAICYDFIKENIKNNKDLKTVTILEKNVFNYTRFHSFLLCNNVVNDFARNMLISFDDYKELFNFKIIYFQLGEKMIEEIDYLEENNLGFKSNDMFPVLKYAIHRQINSGI